MPTLRPRVAVAVVACLAALAATASQPSPARVVSAREDAYRANNIGVTRLEQFDFDAAATSFRRALSLDPQLAIARLNLGIALLYGGNPDAAQKEIIAARASMPDRPQPDYVLGLIARGAGRTAEAIDAFTRVQKMDPDDVGTAINLGQLYRQERKFQEAVDAFRRALAGQPFNATATYGLANTLVLAGNADDGKEAMARFQKLSESGYAVTYSQTYLEQGRYAEAIVSTGAEAPLVDPKTPQIVFTDATKRLPRLGPRDISGSASIVTFDLDSDGDLDLGEAGSPSGGLKILRNDGGTFVNVTSQLPDTAAGEVVDALGVLAGDYDNDGRVDLVVLSPSGLRLLHREPSRFVDSTLSAGLAPPVRIPSSAAWLDADHDGDLDLFVAGGTETAPVTRLYRNNGNGQFLDVTAEAGLTVSAPVTAVIPTDFDNRRDIDLLVVSPTVPPFLFRNLRDGTFKDVAADVGLRIDPGAEMAAVGDVNKDGYSDFFFARPEAAGQLALSDGQGRFITSASPVGAANARAAQFIDYDNDGLLDLLLLTAKGPRLFRNTGRDWTDVTAHAIPAEMSAALARGRSSLAAGDLNGDGRVDVLVDTSSHLTLWQNSGPSRTTSLRVNLAARVSNRSAVGARVEMRAGSLRQQYETYAAVPAPAPADLIFGLGDRASADVVRVLWPSGILQAETGPAASGGAPAAIKGTLKIEELDRKPSSCPYLYTWNGERFEFITDFLGGGEMGYWLAPGLRNTPDPDEYVRIDGARLRPRDGRYELRITNELEESLFLDRAELVAIAHPANVDVHPNEGLVPDSAAVRHLLGAGPASPARRRRRPRPRCPGAYPHDRPTLRGRLHARTRSRIRRGSRAHSGPAQAGTVRSTSTPPQRVDRLCVLRGQRRGAPGRALPSATRSRSEDARGRLAHSDRRHRHAGRPAADCRRRSDRTRPGCRHRSSHQDHDEDLLGSGAGGYI